VNSYLIGEKRQMRVLLADDQMNVRWALQRLLKHEPGMNVVGEASEARGLLAQICTTHPDLVLLDWGLPGLAAIGSLPALRISNPNLLVIVLSGRPEARRKALTAGANVFVSKIDPPEQLLAALHAMDSRRKDMETQTV
jgi:two-component system response regulator DesR